MIQHPTFPSRNQTDFLSYYAGVSFGQCYFHYNYKLSELALLHVIALLKPYRYFSAYWYRRGFYTGYYNSYKVHWQTCLPLMVTKEKREQVMGKLTATQNQVKHDNGNWTGYVNPATLNAHKIPFCIRKISQSVGRYGPQWDLEIMIAEGILETMGASEGTRWAKVTLSRNDTRPTSRDDTLTLLSTIDSETKRDQCPVHNCSFEGKTMRNGNVYIDFKEIDAVFNEEGHEICVACGEEIPKEELEAFDAFYNDTLDDRPF